MPIRISTETDEKRLLLMIDRERVSTRGWLFCFFFIVIGQEIQVDAKTTSYSTDDDVG